jgi:hypothetical protein
MSGLPDENLKEELEGGQVSTGIRGIRSEQEPWLGIVRQRDPQLPQLAGGWCWWRGQVHCPFCLNLIETTLVGLSTFLGPSLVQCRKCGRLLLSHRWEWRDRGVAGKAWYVAVSLVWIGVCAVLSFGCTWGACVLARAPQAWLPGLAAAVWGTAVAGLQTWRVGRSLRRTSGVVRQAHPSGFRNLDFFLPQKVLVGILLSAAALGCLARLAAKQ